MSATIAVRTAFPGLVAHLHEAGAPRRRGGPTFGTRPGGLPYRDMSSGAARSFLNEAPSTDEEDRDRVRQLTGHVDTFFRYHHEQGLSKQQLTSEDIVASQLLHT